MVRQGKSIKRVKNGELQEELGRELKHLRAVVHEVGENYVLRREGEIESLIANLSGIPPGRLQTVAADLLRELHNLKLKPEKGRIKDLKLIDRLIATLAERIMTAQDSGKTPRKKSAVKKP